MKKLFLLGALALAATPGFSATFSYLAPAGADGAFDVVIQVTNVFAGRDTSTDGILSYGFDVAISNPALLTFTGATSGPEFDAAGSVPGTDVFAAASGFGIFPPVTEPLILATLHFNRTAPGLVNIILSSDLSNPFEGLQYLNQPVAESIAATLPIANTPEPFALGISGAGLLLLGALRRRR